MRDLIRSRQQAMSAALSPEGTTAWRVLDEGLGHPCRLEWYDGAVVAWERAGAGAVPDIGEIADALRIDPALVFIKERRRQRDRQHGGQYQPLPKAGAERDVCERGLRFAVNLSDYLDTGLFVDHRALRRRVGSEARGKRVLNLFAYTGAFTVHAAAGGAAMTVTVDMSNTYVRWAERNLDLNRVRGDHRLVKADCVRWLQEQRDRFDVIICDPPTFSNSKAMVKSWEVERDQSWLLWRLWNLLQPGGTAWFSTNKQGFKLATTGLPAFAAAEEVQMLDPDVAGTKPHRTWRLVR